MTNAGETIIIISIINNTFHCLIVLLKHKMYLIRYKCSEHFPDNVRIIRCQEYWKLGDFPN
jgi:hypothetical protein